ncbi:ATP-binding protein [Acidobacteriota bacterium]
MNIYSVPMLITGILCTLLSLITWLFRRRENLNRVFSFFTFALALDSFGYFLWFQFGSIEHINIWMRIFSTIGFLVPIGIILFFFAFTGYDKNMGAKVLGIKVRHFRIAALLLFFVALLVSPFTQLLVKISENPQDIWDYESGFFGLILYPLFAGIFFYLLAMVFKSYRMTDNEPRKRFILLLALGTFVWVLTGFVGALVFSPTSVVNQFINYLGTAVMAVFFFVAIMNYQSDKVHELNINLERKVQDRTRKLEQKNLELEDTMGRLRQMQHQVIVQEKMATLGHLVAGLTHDINTPISAIRSMSDTKAKAVLKLQTALEKSVPDFAKNDHEIRKGMRVILQADRLIDQGTERLNEIMKNLKNFARLDEAETLMADIHEGLDSVLALIEHDLLTNIEVVREYGEIPPFVCHPRKLNQVFFNILKNACQAIEDKGRITITTSLKNNKVYVAIRDTGIGIEQEDLESIFDPGFTKTDPVVRSSLGLSICYQIIQEHHGQINVESQPGKGSVFTVILPTEL